MFRFLPAIFLPDVDALRGGGNVRGGLHALGADDARGRFRIAAVSSADQAPKEPVELLEPLLLSAGEVGVDGLPGRIFVREVGQLVRSS